MVNIYSSCTGINLPLTSCPQAMTARKKKPGKSSPSLPKELPDDPLALINLLEKVWPKPKNKQVSKLFTAIRRSHRKRKPPPKPVAEQPEPAVSRSFNLLDLLRRTFSAHDLLFLRRQITYHIAASSGLPNVVADSDRIQAATASLLEYMATQAPRGSRINVQLKEIALRTGNGMEVIFSGTDQSLRTVDKTSFLQRMYEAETESGMVLVTCRELVSAQGGQMWADLPRPGHHVFHMVLPTHEGAVETAAKPNKMYKYDISIANYANVRKRFGIKKSLTLVGQIEMYVRALVRHPIDIVTAVKEKGIITTIYESPKGAAQSVASRISQRLGAEEFRIGKRPVDLLFRYQLTQLPTASSRAAAAGKGSLDS